MRRLRWGFSLIELMVVMAIIAILVSIALPRYTSSVDHARLVALESNLRVMRQAIDRYYEDRAKFPESLQALVDGKYLKAIPVDPITGSASSWLPVEDREGDRTGIVDVHSGAKGSSPQGDVYGEL